MVCGFQTLFVGIASADRRNQKPHQILGFRGVLTGRLLLATKLLPASYVLRAWLITIAGLTKDLARLKWRFAATRIKILSGI